MLVRRTHVRPSKALANACAADACKYPRARIHFTLLSAPTWTPYRACVHPPIVVHQCIMVARGCVGWRLVIVSPIFNNTG